MNTADRRGFAQAIGRLFAIYGESVTEAVIDAWWGTMQPYPFADVLEGMNRHAVDPQAGMFRPTPAHVIKHMEALNTERARRVIQARHAAQPKIDKIEDELYRIEHDLEMGRIDRDHGLARRSDLHRYLRQVRSETEQNIIEAIGNDVHQDHAQRKIGAGTE